MSVLAKFGGCLLIASSLGLPQAPPSKSEAPNSLSPVEEIRNAIANQDSYRKAQQRRVCTYTRTLRSAYGTGQSLSRRVVSDQVLFTIGEDDPEQQSTPTDTRAVSAVTFDLWNHPLFQAILKDSVFTRTRESTEWDGRKSQIYQFAPTSNFQPSNDTERIAQAIYGTVSIDETTHLFDGMHGLAMQDVYEGKRLLLLGPHRDGPIPLFTYFAGPADGVIVPKLWDEARFNPVTRGKNETTKWLATLSRTFVRVESCRDFKVKSTIRPGFSVVSPSQDPQP